MNSMRRIAGSVAKAVLVRSVVLVTSLLATGGELKGQTTLRHDENSVPLTAPADYLERAALGLPLAITASLRPTVAFALAHSPTFREQYERARSWPDVVVRLGLASPQSLFGTGARGNTRWLATPRVIRRGSRLSFAGTIDCRAAIAPQRELAAVLAHELAHANELARYGSITRAPGFRPSASGSYLAETEPALEIGRRVSQELQRARVGRLSPLDIALLLDPILLDPATPPATERRAAHRTQQAASPSEGRPQQ